MESVDRVLASFDESPAPEPPTHQPSTPSILRLNRSWIDDELALLPPIADVLIGNGWQQARSSDGYGQHWTRPGKDPREGHSASLSTNGRLYVHSSSAGLDIGNPTHDALDVILFYALGRRPTADERVSYLRARRSGGTAAAAPAGASSQAADPGPASLNLPPEFWSERPYLAHIHQAALSARLSPDALWAATKCFYAATIPWNHRLPGDGTMDYIAIIVGASGAGKSRAKHAAYLLLEDLHQIVGVRFPIPTGSGEGMTEVFIERENKERRYKLRGAGFYADEGQFLLDIHSRAGNTTMQAIKQLWSGELTGQVAATAERHRWLDPRDVRATLLISATPDTAASFMRGDLTDGGLPQRVSWAWAHYPHPDNAPEHPGPLHPPVYDHNRATGGPYVVELEAELATLVDAKLLAGSRGEQSDGLEGHATYAILKEAAIHAHLEGRLRVCMQDWRLSVLSWETTRRVRAYLLSQQQRGQLDRNEAAGIARAHSRFAEERVYLERAVHSLVTKVKGSGALSMREAKSHLRAFSRRHGIDHREVVALAIDRGLVNKLPSGELGR